jgi:hypothetical protein
MEKIHKVVQIISETIERLSLNFALKEVDEKYVKNYIEKAE